MLVGIIIKDALLKREREGIFAGKMEKESKSVLLNNVEISII